MLRTEVVKVLILFLALLFTQTISPKILWAHNTFSRVTVFQDPAIEGGRIYYLPSDNLLKLSPHHPKLQKVLALLDEAGRGGPIDLARQLNMVWIGDYPRSENPNLPYDKKWPMGAWGLLLPDDKITIWSRGSEERGLGLLLSFTDPNSETLWTDVPIESLKRIRGRPLFEALHILARDGVLDENLATEIARSSQQWVANSEFWPTGRPEFILDQDQKAIWRFAEAQIEKAGRDYKGHLHKENILNGYRENFLVRTSQQPEKVYLFDRAEELPLRLSVMGEVQMVYIPKDADDTLIGGLAEILLKGTDPKVDLHIARLSSQNLEGLAQDKRRTMASVFAQGLAMGEFAAKDLGLALEESNSKTVFKVFEMRNHLLVSVPHNRRGEFEVGSMHKVLLSLWSNAHYFWVELDGGRQDHLKYLIIPPDAALSDLMLTVWDSSHTIRISNFSFPYPAEPETTKLYSVVDLQKFHKDHKDARLADLLRGVGIFATCSNLTKGIVSRHR